MREADRSYRTTSHRAHDLPPSETQSGLKPVGFPQWAGLLACHHPQLFSLPGIYTSGIPNSFVRPTVAGAAPELVCCSNLTGLPVSLHDEIHH